MSQIGNGDLRHDGGFEHGDDDLADERRIDIRDSLRQHHVKEY